MAYLGNTTLEDTVDTANIKDGAVTDVKLASGIVPTKTAFRATNTSSQTANGSGATVINFQSAGANKGSDFDTANSRYVCPADGYYFFTADISVEGGDGNDDTMYLGIYENGSLRAEVRDNWRYQTGSGREYTTTVSAVVGCDAGDYIDLRYRGISTSITIVNGDCTFNGFLLFED